MAKLSAYPFFVADYTGSVTYPGAYQMWQYSSTGRVPGISGNVDLDHSYVDFLPAIQAGGYNGYEPEIPGLEMVPVPG
jgi:GH25 family lysozyme M1 (1,4-beta-N-acetylmuramidase)